jgi:arylsulfatase A-like enzyme
MKRMRTRFAAAAMALAVTFWSPSLVAHKIQGGGFRTIDILPTILQAMGIPAGPMDGSAWSLG